MKRKIPYSYLAGITDFGGAIPKKQGII